ncbi:MAG: hypothetical protein HGGPFJEG_00846 [Ignavibacteria bacterium]|nr:hypothetical protein [Ignavibacteria bacterium]
MSSILIITGIEYSNEGIKFHFKLFMSLSLADSNEEFYRKLILYKLKFKSLCKILMSIIFVHQIKKTHIVIITFIDSIS